MTRSLHFKWPFSAVKWRKAPAVKDYHGGDRHAHGEVDLTMTTRRVPQIGITVIYSNNDRKGET